MTRSIPLRTIFAASLLLCTAHAQLDPSASYRVAGTVINAKGGAPLPQARVFLTDVKNPKNAQTQLTTDDGHFAFQVSAGKYVLRGAKRGYISADYNQHEQFSTAIVTGAGVDTENLILQLAPTAILFGKILDENGDPVRSATVTLWREDHSTGLSRIARYRNDVTDDQGAYEFSALDSGSYFLSASARPWYAVHPSPIATPENSEPPLLVDRSLDVVYPTTYYAGATESEDATPIPIRGGDRQELELRLLPLPAVHLTLHTPQKSSGEAEGNVFPNPVLHKRVFDEIEARGDAETQMTAKGEYEIITAPGKYSIQINGPQGVQVSEVELSQEHQELDTSAGETLSNMVVSVHMLEGAPIPEQLFVGLLDHRGRGVVFQRVNPNGNAEFLQIPPGTYEFSVGSTRQILSVVRVTSEGHNTSGRTFKLSPATIGAVDVFVATGSAQVEGLAQQGGKPVAGAMIVLVPKHPESNRDLFRRDQSDLDGTFTFRAVIPGTYTVIAIADGWDLDWSQAAVIAHYATKGQPLVIPAHSDHSLKLPAPVEVQPK
jgi:hypothetical protein